jgi:hypothetical protein
MADKILNASPDFFDILMWEVNLLHFWISEFALISWLEKSETYEDWELLIKTFIRQNKTVTRWNTYFIHKVLLRKVKVGIWRILKAKRIMGPVFLADGINSEKYVRKIFHKDQ